MAEFIALIGAIPGGFPLAALLAFGVLAVIKGWIVPSKVVEERMSDKNEEIKRLREDRDDRYAALMDERDKWRAAAEKSAEGLDKALDVNDELMETARTMRHFLNALPQLDDKNAQVIMPTKGGESNDSRRSG